MAKAEPTKFLADNMIDGQSIVYGEQVPNERPGVRYAFIPNGQGGVDMYVVGRETDAQGNPSYSYNMGTTPAIAASLYGYTGYTPTAAEQAHYGSVEQNMLAGAGTPAPGTQGTPPLGQGGTSSQATQAAAATDQQFTEWLNSQNLSSDQKAAITSLYNAVGTNDLETAERIKKAIAAGTAYSDPYFKAQAALLTDALDRGMNNIDGDLAFNEQSLNNRLQDIQKTLQQSGEYLSFQHTQELKDLERKLTADMEGLQEDMASRGFTNSSIRTKKTNILTDVYGDLRESSNRAFQYKVDTSTNQLNTAQRDTALEVQRLQQLAAQGKLDLLRKAESQLGSSAVNNLGYQSQTLGGIGGELPRAQMQDALSFASNSGFVF